MRDEYLKDMDDFINNLRHKLSAVSCEFESLCTDQDLGHALCVALLE